MDFWTAKSKYGATIKDALDFVFRLGPGKEDVSDIFPHVAAIAAAYGDPTGTYMAYLKKMDKNYMTAPYYYYNQPGAFTMAPTSAKGKGKNVAGLLFSEEEAVEAAILSKTPSLNETSVLSKTPTLSKTPSLSKTPTSTKSNGVTSVTIDHTSTSALDVTSTSITPTETSALPTPTIPFECPEAFATATEVELDDGVYVTCDELKHFYGYAADTASNVGSDGSNT